jgi:hypothetical protein
VEHLRQLPFKHVKFGNLLLDSAQLLGHERLQVRTHRETRPAVKFRHQGFKLRERES